MTIFRPLGWFHCSHGHCEGRRQGDVFDWITSKITPSQGRQIAKAMPQSLALALRVMGRAS